MSTNSSKGSFINTVSLAVQPFASVTVTVCIPGVNVFTVSPCCPFGNHVKV